MGGCASVVQAIAGATKFEDVFEIGKELGKGHFAAVHICTEIKTKVQYAVKVIDKENLCGNSFFRDEVDILRQVGNHDHVLHLSHVFEDKDALYIVTDLCSGGDLFQRIVDDGAMSEKRTSEIMKQLAAAINHIHKCGITHRDLKPENILLSKPGPEAKIKVADFGLSKLREKDTVESDGEPVEDQDEMMETICGTWAYCAPEVIKRMRYDNKVDNWTLGVLMFILLSGYHPFDVYGDLSEVDLLNKIENGQFDFDDEVWEEVSDGAKAIIKQLLQVNPLARLEVEEFLASDWVNGKGLTNKPMTKAHERFKCYHAAMQVRIAMSVNKAVKKFKAGGLKRMLLKKKSAKKDKNDAAATTTKVEVVPATSPVVGDQA